MTTKTDQVRGLQLERPRLENGKPLIIAGLRGHYTTATWAGLPAQWQRFAFRLGEIPGQVGRTTYGLSFNLPNGVDYLTGVEVTGIAGLPDEFSHVSIPAQRYAVFPHRGHVSKVWDTCDAIGKWLPESGYQPAPTSAGAPDFFERYGPGFDPQIGMGDIEVWVPIKP